MASEGAPLPPRRSFPGHLPLGRKAFSSLRRRHPQRFQALKPRPQFLPETSASQVQEQLAQKQAQKPRSRSPGTETSPGAQEQCQGAQEPRSSEGTRSSQEAQEPRSPGAQEPRSPGAGAQEQPGKPRSPEAKEQEPRSPGAEPNSSQGSPGAAQKPRRNTYDNSQVQKPRTHPRFRSLELSPGARPRSGSGAAQKLLEFINRNYFIHDGRVLDA